LAVGIWRLQARQKVSNREEAKQKQGDVQLQDGYASQMGKEGADPDAFDAPCS